MNGDREAAAGAEGDEIGAAAASQVELVHALADPAIYAHRPERVEHLQTHISHVFLAGPYVFKLKKAVRFSFLDFSTRELRRHFCHEELRLNRRLSPAVYLDVLPITRRDDGTLTFGGAGAALDHVLRMRRLPSDRMLPVLLAADAVAPPMMDALAGLIATFHAGAPSDATVAAHASPEAIRTHWADTIATLAPFAVSGLARVEHAILADFGPRFVATHEALLRARQAGGRIRDGHGDLHAEHVCFVDAPVADAPDAEPLAAGIYVFDCIEFSPGLRCNDVAGEIAFLTMDLELRGRRDLAERFARAYSAAADDPALAALLPFYASARACVRATVESLTSAELEVDVDRRAAAAVRAGRYLRLAVRCAWRAHGPMLLVAMGLSGTGKSTLADALADVVDAVVVRSDVIRKRPDGGTALPTSDDARYTPTARGAVYETLAAETERELAAGRSVIADATFIRRADRDRVRAVAAGRGVPCLIVECRADAAAVRARLAARTAHDVSDARWDTYVAQERVYEPLGADEPRLTVETDAAPETVCGGTLERLWSWRTAAR